MNIIRTDSQHPDFVSLVRLLDADLSVRDGSEHAFYSQFNTIDALKHVVLAYDQAQPVGCGAIKPLEPGVVEVKRMFTLPSSRGKGVASIVLQELEHWAAEQQFEKCRLETGKKQPEAIALYEKQGYMKISNYGQYAGVENSVCFEKVLR